MPRPPSHAAQSPTQPPPVRIGVSSCLMGEPVRWDGSHRGHRFVIDPLARHVELHPVCPEVAIGLGVPREPIRLLARAEGVRAVGCKHPALDLTEALRAYGRRMAGTLPELHGYLFKRASPSCGMARVKVYREKGGRPAQRGVGVYAAEIMAHEPLLPVEDEGRLEDAGLREHFIERVFAYYRWKRLLEGGLTLRALIGFHNRHQLALMAHGTEPLRRLGRLVAGGAGLKPARLAETYGAGFMALLGRQATPKTHSNVLRHLLGYLRKHLDASHKAELVELIHAYRERQVPLSVPMALLNHHFRKFPHPQVAGQVYLNPHPAELMLRSVP